MGHSSRGIQSITVKKTRQQAGKAAQQEQKASSSYCSHAQKSSVTGSVTTLKPQGSLSATSFPAATFPVEGKLVRELLFSLVIFFPRVSVALFFPYAVALEATSDQNAFSFGKPTDYKNGI